jgi:hypothetical protein
MTVITISRNELTRLRVQIDVADGRLLVADATGLIGVGRRQIYRLLDAFRARGPDGLISRKPRAPGDDRRFGFKRHSPFYSRKKPFGVRGCQGCAVRGRGATSQAMKGPSSHRPSRRGRTR